MTGGTQTRGPLALCPRGQMIMVTMTMDIIAVITGEEAALSSCLASAFWSVSARFSLSEARLWPPSC